MGVWVCGLARSQLARACELCIRVGGAWASYVISDHKIILYILDNSERGSKAAKIWDTALLLNKIVTKALFFDTVSSQLHQLHVYAQLS